MNAHSILENINGYIGQTAYWAFILIILTYFFYKSKTEINKLLCIYMLISFFIILNPLFYKVVGDKLGFSNVYYRFFWLVPVFILLAYVLADLVGNQKKKGLQVMMLLIFSMLIINLGTPMFAKSELKFPENPYKVSNDVISISQWISNDKEIEQPKVLMDFAMDLEIRQYDASILPSIPHDCYRRVVTSNETFEGWGSTYAAYKNLMNIFSDNLEFTQETLKDGLSRTNPNYIVVKKEFMVNNNLAEMNIPCIGESDNYNIYRYK
jgi:uncharacterized membrane protein YhaH (DUF805 family)